MAGQAEALAEEHLTPNNGGREPMYLPELFRVEDVPQMHALMRARPFAALVSSGSAGLFASHLPTILKDEGRYGVIECHLARANPHWRDLADGGEALMIFQGAEGYITPNWYPSKAEGGKVVPTWNFAVVHAYGRAEVMNDEQWLRRHVTGLTAQQEKDQSRPWAPSDAPSSFVELDAARDHRLPLCRHAPRRQVEDEPESNAEGPRGRRERSRVARPRRRSRDCRTGLAVHHARRRRQLKIRRGVVIARSSDEQSTVHVRRTGLLRFARNDGELFGHFHDPLL